MLAISQTCKRCHYDKYAKLRESIHYKVLQQKGGVNVPTCVECHGGHAISSVSRDRLSTVRKCRGCHEKVYEIYAGSVHGNALFNKHNRDVPICTDCHTAHQVKDPYTAEYHENIPDTCSSCHSNEAVMAKYGISTNVIKTYLSDFHGVTLSMLRDQESLSPRKVRSIAVCTDCHGTHDIMRVSRYSPELL
ncbi:MAG: cytochrome C, partial [Gammaproteobacteria bacterium]|nr:cytochrome C [Gammaproteobacteria bacterium]